MSKRKASLCEKDNNKTRIQVVCRPARQSDKPQVIALIKRIWNDDYIPLTWADWIADSEGVLGVAEYAGQVVALGKLTRLSEKDWWLEGLRVDPDYEGRHVASQLNAFLLAHWEEDGAGDIRLATSSEQKAVHRISANHGFLKIAEVITYKAPILETEEDLGILFQPLHKNAGKKALTSLMKSPALALQDGLIDLGWQWAPPRQVYLQESIEKGLAWWWRNGRGLLAISEFGDEEDPSTLLRFLASKVEDMTGLLKDYRCLVGKRGRKEAKWHAPVRAEVRTVLETAGFKCDSDHSIVIFERRGG